MVETIAHRATNAVEAALPWLLESGTPAVRYRALRELVGLPDDDPRVREAEAAAMKTDPIASILAAQAPDGWWVSPGGGYAPKYTGTVWSLIFLDQLGANGDDPRVARGCEYVLKHAAAPDGGFGVGRGSQRATASSVIHCLNGNLLRALVGFGRLQDERVAAAVAWQVSAITGEGRDRWSAATPGSGFRCGANEGLPCGWGATKAVLALARIPEEERTEGVSRAIEAGVEFLLSVDPATAAYPAGWGNARPSGSWFKLGFPSGYVADVLQVLEALCDAGAGGDGRLDHALQWLLGEADDHGRWVNRYPYQGKMHVDIDQPGKQSKWVTLRACRVLRSVAVARAAGA